MGEKRQFEVLLLRLVPHALRDDFMTVGVVVLEDSRQPSAPSPCGSGQAKNSHQEERSINLASTEQTSRGIRFADVRFTRDLKRVECFAPDLEIEILEYLEKEVRGRLGEIRGRGELLQLLEEKFGTVFDVGPGKGLMAEDPAAEMRVLERDYLAPVAVGASVERARRLGRLGIVAKMQDAFAEAGVLDMLQRDLDMREFTGENDPFRVDFGFRVGTHPSKPKAGLLGTPVDTLKMFHALALNLSREPAVTLAYRYGRIREGMRARGEDALMTAVVSDEAMRGIAPNENRVGWGTREVGSGIAMLRANEIEVRGLGEMEEIAERVRREVRA